MTSGRKSITAIVCTYNRSAFLAEALDSIAAQTRTVDEIIVWDDGSTDDTESVARNARQPVHYFRSENGGKAKALNQAIARAEGDRIWICDDDDITLPEAAETLSQLLDDNPHAGVAAGCYSRFTVNPETGERDLMGPGFWPELGTGSALRHILEDIFIFQNATLVDRTRYDEVGPFREDLARSIDYEMLVRLAVCYPVVVTEKVLFLQRKHDGARGPAAARHAAEKSEEVWKATDRQIFAEFREQLPLELYVAMYSSSDPQGALRAGLLQRACVYARRTDWPAALDDFRAAAELTPGVPLSVVEKNICRRAVSGKHGVREMLDRPNRRALHKLAAGSPVGAEIAASLARGLVWRVRKAVGWGGAAQALRLSGIAGELLLAGRARKAGGEASDVTELKNVPRSGPLPIRSAAQSGD